MADIDNLKQAYVVTRMRLGQMGFNLRLVKKDVIDKCAIHSSELMDGSAQMTPRHVVRHYNEELFGHVRNALYLRDNLIRKEYGFSSGVDFETIAREAESMTKRWIILKAIMDTIDIERKVYMSFEGVDISSIYNATQSPEALLKFFGEYKFNA